MADKATANPDSALDPSTFETIDALAAEYEHWAAVAKHGEDMRKILGEQMDALLEACDAARIQTTAYRISRVAQPGRWTLDEKRLLQNGVDADVIAASKTQGKPSSFVKVTKGKAGYVPEVVRRAGAAKAEDDGAGE